VTFNNPVLVVTNDYNVMDDSIIVQQQGSPKLQKA